MKQRVSINTWDESATDARAVKAPSWTICLPFWKTEYGNLSEGGW
jgi:hypothetical protein